MTIFVKVLHLTQCLANFRRRSFLQLFILWCLDEHRRQQECSYQGEALNVPTTYLGLWSSNNIFKKIKQNEIFFLKFEIFYENQSPHTPNKVQKDRFRYL